VLTAVILKYYIVLIVVLDGVAACANSSNTEIVCHAYFGT
jgi:hypothetical protein